MIQIGVRDTMRAVLPVRHGRFTLIIHVDQLPKIEKEEIFGRFLPTETDHYWGGFSVAENRPKPET